MNRDRLLALARTPRPITPELTAVSSPSHPLYDAGCYLAVLGLAGVLLGLLGLGVVGLAATGVFGALAALIPYWWVGVALAVVGMAPAVLGGALMAATASSAKKRGAEELSTAPLVLAAVVQGHSELFTPGAGTYPAVLVFSLSPERALDADWIREVAARLYGLRDIAPADPMLAQLRQRLHDERSTFDEALPAAFTGDAQTFWKVEVLSKSDLPGKCVPPDRVLPFFCKSEKRYLTSVPPALLT